MASSRSDRAHAGRFRPVAGHGPSRTRPPVAHPRHRPCHTPWPGLSCWRCTATSGSGGGCRSKLSSCRYPRTDTCGSPGQDAARSAVAVTTATQTARARCAGACSAASRWSTPPARISTAAPLDGSRSMPSRCPPPWLTRSVTWHAGADADTAVAEWCFGGHTLRPEIRVGADGTLRSVTMPRWASPHGEPWGKYACGGILEGEASFGGITMPTRMRAGYFFGTERWGEGEFFRATITDAHFL
jgi:hypothetical protein